MSHRRLSISLIAAIRLIAADLKPVVKTQGFLPFADAPIYYRSTKNLNNQITQLNRKLEIGEARLEYKAEHGYLRSVLEALGVPEPSQTLVFSKTSLQFQNISPATPRALYFNDNVYVGQVRNAKSLELISFDANQGAVFYVLSEHETDKPRFERAQLDCVQCHIAAATRGIPGVMVRSVVTSSSGFPKAGAAVHTMGHETPIEKRWGGWYVTGSEIAGLHPRGQRLEEAIDTKQFPIPHSDAVAHLVLPHQTQMHNLITETNYRYRLGARAGTSFENAAEATLRYLLFAGEVELPTPVSGSSPFAAEFAGLGPRASVAAGDAGLNRALCVRRAD